MTKEKLTSYVVQVVIVTGSCMLALWGYNYLNRAKVAPPSTTTSAQ